MLQIFIYIVVGIAVFDAIAIISDKYQYKDYPCAWCHTQVNSCFNGVCHACHHEGFPMISVESDAGGHRRVMIIKKYPTW